MTAAPLNHSLLDLPRVEVFKTDRRSTVWRVDAPDQPLVIKRFDHAPIRQRLGLLVHLHPAQRERKQNAAMLRDGLPIVPVLASLSEPRGLGCRVHLVSALSGVSLQRTLPTLVGEERRHVLEAVGELASQLIARGWYFRDLKTANIVLDHAGSPRLIDVGSARRSRNSRKIAYMLNMLAHTLRQAGANEDEIAAVRDRKRAHAH